MLKKLLQNLLEEIRKLQWWRFKTNLTNNISLSQMAKEKYGDIGEDKIDEGQLLNCLV